MGTQWRNCSMHGSMGRAVNNSAIACRVLWNQLPELGDDLPSLFCSQMVYASFTSFGVTELDRTKVCGCGLGKISPQPNPSDGAKKGVIQPCVADKEAVLPCGGTPMSEQLTINANILVNTLNDMGIKIKKNLYCVPNNEKVSLMQEKDVDGNYVVNVRVYGMYNAESQLGEYIPHGVVSNTSCDEVEVFGTADGTAYDDLVSYGLGIAGVLNEGAVILLLAIYILLERPEGSTFSLSNRVVRPSFAYSLFVHSFHARRDRAVLLPPCS